MQRSSVLIIAVLLCSSCGSSASRSATTVTTTTTPTPLLGGASITFPTREADVKPLVQACLSEALAVTQAPEFGEGCNEAALAADHIGLATIAVDLRTLVATADPTDRRVIVKKLQDAIDKL